MAGKGEGFGRVHRGPEFLGGQGLAQNLQAMDSGFRVQFDGGAVRLRAGGYGGENEAGAGERE